MINDTDKTLFAQAVKDVVPLGASKQYIAQPIKTNPTNPLKKGLNYQANNPLDDPIINHYVSSDAIIKYSVKQISNTQAFHQLKKGLISFEATLDLHHHTLIQAHQILANFLQNNHLPYCFKIVHGKGLHSKHNRALLKSFVADYLKNHPKVLAYHSCQARHGGTGAVLVLLKQ